MIVSQSNLNLDSTHSKQQSRTVHQSLQYQASSADGSVTRSTQFHSDKASLSDKAMELARRVAGESGINVSSRGYQSFSQGSQQLTVKQTELSDLGNGVTLEQIENAAPLPGSLNGGSTTVAMPHMQDAYVTLAESVIRAITGKDMEFFDGRTLEEMVDRRLQTALPAIDISSQEFSLDLDSAVGRSQEGMRFNHVENYHESEETTFSATGEIHTADGKKIDISLMMQMHRSYSTSNSTTITAGVQLKDPLIINFDASSTELTDAKYSFDLDADGTNENISFVKPGSGMLMLDKNGDGKANDGTELFGALSGDGFADLRQYDEDGNGFIDEGDSVYSQLKIWVKTDQGNDQYFSLADKDVGAIYLGAVKTPFDLKDENNEMHGQVRTTSFFVGEQGNGGTVQQIDLVV